MNIKSLLFLLLLLPFAGSAQNHLLDSLRTAYEQARQDTDIVQHAIQFAIQLNGYDADSAQLLCVQAGALARSITPPEAKVLGLRKVGLGFTKLGDLDSALAYLQPALRLAESIDFKKGLGFTHNSLGSTYRSKDSLDRAMYHFKQALALHREREDPNEQSADLSNIGLIYMDQGRYDQAIHYFQQALTIQDSLDNKYYQAIFNQNIAVCEQRRNRLEQSIPAYERALALWEDLDRLAMQAINLNAQSSVYREMGEFSLALERQQAALTIREILGDEKMMSRSFAGMGAIYTSLEEYAKSAEYYRRALKHAKAVDDLGQQALALNSLGRSLIFQQAYAPALDTLYLSRQLREKVGPERLLAYPLYNLGSVYEKMGQPDSASFYLQAAYQVAERYQNNYLMTLSLTDMAKVERRKGALNQAISLLDRARQLSPPDNYVKDKMVIDQLLYELYKEQGNSQEALLAYERFQATEDSLFNKKNAREIARLEANYQLEQERQQLAYQQEQEVAQQRASRRIIVWTLLGALLCILVISWSYWQKQRTNNKLRELNGEILSQKAQLEEMDRVKSRFFANISHELRTPLTLIIGPIQSLREENLLSDKGKTYLSLMQSNGQKLMKRINEILDLSKLDTQGMEVQEKATQLFELAGMLVNGYQAIAEREKIALSLDYRLPGELRVMLDRDKFEKILSNYLSNAVKYTPKEGRITVLMQDAAGKLRLSVANTGPGLPAHELPHLFDRFYQASNAENKGGTGIGLAICKELAELMQGRVWAESDPERGSSFYLELPLKNRTEELPISPEQDLPPAENGGKALATFGQQPSASRTYGTVLLVEDEADLRTYISEVLSEYRIIQAEDGEEALAILRADQGNLPSLILSDIMMPRLDGYALVDQLKTNADWQSIPVIMLTAKSAEEDKLKALRLGVDDYLTKPFYPQELKLRVHNLLQNARQRQTYLSEHPPSEAETLTVDQSWLRDLETAAQSALDQGLDLSKTYLADQMLLSDRHLLRRLKSLTGMTIKQYVLEVKLQRARRLLDHQTFSTIAEVAYACGFNSPGYFSRIYEQHFGRRPGR